MLAGEGFRVRILMSSQLYGRLEGFRAVRALVGADLGVRQQMVVVYAVSFEPI